MGTGTLVLPGFGHQRDDRVDVVALHWVVGDPVGTGEAADDAPVDQHEPFAAAVLDALGAHHAVAGRGPVAWGSRTRPPVLTWASMRPARTR